MGVWCEPACSRNRKRLIKTILRIGTVPLCFPSSSLLRAFPALRLSLSPRIKGSGRRLCPNPRERETRERVEKEKARRGMWKGMRRTTHGVRGSHKAPFTTICLGTNSRLRVITAVARSAEPRERVCENSCDSHSQVLDESTRENERSGSGCVLTCAKRFKAADSSKRVPVSLRLDCSETRGLKAVRVKKILFY